MPTADHDEHIRVTEAERAVLRLVADGLTDEEIAERLGREGARDTGDAPPVPRADGPGRAAHRGVGRYPQRLLPW